ncbi:toxin-antitoxin system YwqK family antitoxin [Vibrio mexicanus]|uniref:toxin-antitoxin system YwqK family antitoxin n=1 Tax=Vibrio mexicanus TaxID=1004326 RepID=UPI00063C591D|nr:hypothetical protein [Vibrio mexicanus]
MIFTRISLICLLLISTNAFAQNWYEVELGDEGYETYQGYILEEEKKVVKHGQYKRFNNANDLLELTFYQHGLRNGLSTRYYEELKLKFEGLYQQGLPNGLHQNFRESGKLYAQHHYKSGVLLKSLHYDVDGYIVSEHHYLADNEELSISYYEGIKNHEKLVRLQPAPEDCETACFANLIYEEQRDYNTDGIVIYLTATDHQEGITRWKEYDNIGNLIESGEVKEPDY